MRMCLPLLVLSQILGVYGNSVPARQESPFGRAGGNRVEGTLLPPPGESTLPPGVAVTLSRLDEEDRWSAPAMGRGFVFTDLPPGDYILLVRAAGYLDSELRLSLQSLRRDTVSVSIGVGEAVTEALPPAGRSIISAAALRTPPKALRSYRRALRAEDRGDAAKAVRELEGALHEHPSFVPALNRLGVLHLRRGRFPEAEACFEKAIGFDPGNFAARKNLGYLLVATGRAAAVSQLAAASALRSDDAETWAFLGEAHYWSGEIAESARALERALALDPKMTGAARRLEEIRARLP
jgi:hypothetical protein